MRNITLALVALAAGLVIASIVTPNAKAQSTLTASMVPPRTWPPRAEDIVTFQREVQTVPGGDVEVFRVPSDKYLVIRDIDFHAGYGQIWVETDFSGGALVDIEVLGVDGAWTEDAGPLGIPCRPSSRIVMRGTAPSNLAYVRIRGYYASAY